MKLGACSAGSSLLRGGGGGGGGRRPGAGGGGGGALSVLHGTKELTCSECTKSLTDSHDAAYPRANAHDKPIILQSILGGFCAKRSVSYCASAEKLPQA